MTSNDKWASLATLNLSRQPVAVGFLTSAPSDLERISQAAAAGCSYWKLAAEGRAFYTTPEDHHNCPVGAFTHGVSLEPAKAAELHSLIGTMIELHYLRSEEIPSIPHRSAPLQFAAYAPASRASFPADVVIFTGSARQIMLLTEAARAAGILTEGTMLGRPACAMLPQTLSASSGVASIGCIGNRVYTDLPDEEMYLTVPANAVDAMLGTLDTIVAANSTLEHYHRQRAAQFVAQ